MATSGPGPGTPALRHPGSASWDPSWSVTEFPPALAPGSGRSEGGTLDSVPEPMSPEDERIVAEQLGRRPRGVVGIAWRCPCGRPGVVMTAPRLPDGTPFPTVYYLTCPRAVSACSTLEASGLMADQTARLGTDVDLAARYRAAHQAYLSDRAALGQVSEIDGISAGGMPDRVKCLHVLAAHALAAGRGVNPLGGGVVDRVGEFWTHPCGDREGA